MRLADVDLAATRGTSALHRASPAVKLLAFALVVGAVLVNNDVLILAGMALVLVSVAVAARLPAKPVAVLVSYPAFFGAVFAATTSAGLLDGLAIAAKAVSAALAALLVVFTTPYPQMFAPVQPLVPRVLGDAMLLVYRSFFLLVEKFDNLLRSVRLRACFLGGQPVRSARAAVRAMEGLLLYSLDLSQRTYDVMRARGYSGRLRVARRDSAHWVLDAAVLGGALGLSAIAVAWRVAYRVLGPGSWLVTVGGAAVLGAGAFARAPGRSDPVVLVSCVSHMYEDGTSVSLCGLDFVAEAGQRVAVLGPNGSGKTTLLFHVLGLLRPQEGVVRVFGKDPSTHWPELRERVGVVLQNVDEQLLAPTVEDDVAFSPRQYGLPDREVDKRVRETLELLGIADLAPRVPHNLSGGERRKVALAGALVVRPELLVLDEPFEGLDPASRDGLVTLLNGIAARGATVIIATHDIDTVPEFADEAYVLTRGGDLVLKGPPAELFRRVDQLASENIRPPVLAELFAELKRGDPGAPPPALSPKEAAAALLAWKRQAR